MPTAAVAPGSDVVREDFRQRGVVGHASSFSLLDFRIAIVAWAKNPIVGVAFAAVCLTVFIVAFVLPRSARHQELVQNKPEPTHHVVPPQTAKTQPLPAKVRGPQAPKILAFTLLPTERDAGEGNRFLISSGVYTVRLRLPPVPNVYRNYHAVLSTPEQHVIAKTVAHGHPSDYLYVEFSSKVLNIGDYILRVYGSGGIGGAAPTPQEEVAAYSFRVVRDQSK